MLTSGQSRFSLCLSGFFGPCLISEMQVLGSELSFSYRGYMDTQILSLPLLDFADVIYLVEHRMSSIMFE